jgi:hypothetical protein
LVYTDRRNDGVILAGTPQSYKRFTSDKYLQGDQKVSAYSNNLHTIDDLKMAITVDIRNVDRAMLNTVFENTVRRVDKCLETGGGHLEHYL